MEQDDDKDALTESDFPVINLANQLGFIGEGGSKKIEQQFLFPLLKHSKSSYLWGNRNLLECSLHVDNWIAIKSGAYIQNMGLEMKDVTQHYWKFDHNKKLEYDRNRFQQLFMAPFDEHFEQTLTFMGSSMESLRSILAEWTLKNKVLQRSGWAPSLARKDSYLFPFDLSPDFKNCISLIKCEDDMEAMGFKMRLIWELQNFFRENIIASGKGPQDENAWAMCILSFPALSVNVSRKSNRRHGDFVIVQVEEDSVNNGDDTSGIFDPYEYQVLIKPEGLPSCCELIVNLDSECLNVRLQRDPKYIRFNWEDWRDAFQGRLEGLRKWQLENWCSSSMDDESEAKDKHVLIRAESQIQMGDIRYPIYSGIERKDLVGAGIGDYLKIWKGWLPHRRNMCHFELTTKDLIKTRKSLDVEAQKIKVYGRTMTIQCPQIQYKSEKYADCDRESLQRCTVISAAAIRRLSSGGRDDVHNLSAGLGESLRKLADRMTGNPQNRNCTVSMTMYETAAVYYGDIESLEKALDILYGEEKYEQASTLIELFFYSRLAKRKIKFTKENPVASNFVRKVRDLFENCITKADYSSSIAVQYAQLCLYLSNLGHSDCIENAKNILQRVFLQSSGSSFNENILQCIKLYCDLLFCTEHMEDLDLEEMIMGKMRTFANSVTEAEEKNESKDEFIRGLTYLDKRLLYKNENYFKVEEMGKELEFALARFFSEKANTSTDDMKLAKHLYEMSARKNHKNASYNLAIMLQSEPDKKNSVEAKKYFEKALGEGCFQAAFKLARMLQNGEEGVEKNIRDSVYYFRKSIDAGYLKAAINLGNIYRKGTGVETDIEEAISLFREASDAGHTKGTFALICILKGDEGEEYKCLKDAVRYLNKAFQVIRDRNYIDNTESIGLRIRNVEEMLEENEEESKIGLIVGEILAGLKNIYTEANKK